MMAVSLVVLKNTDWYGKAWTATPEKSIPIGMFLLFLVCIAVFKEIKI
jgi:hypothetical protein